ncbi:MAG: YihY/virulence factor BrkB family protein [Candidatus Aminicenantes bacterium]|nr:YihY/virulence factor BrkB family protein [Candidatus Aminicenantes bacterium]
MSRKRVNFISSLNHFLTEDLWKIDFRRLPPFKAFFLKHLRIGILVIRRFIKNRVKVRASALVYATLMSIVPLLAVVFSLLKGFGYHNQLEPFLNRVLEPLGTQAIQVIVPNIMNFVGNAKVAALGTIGFLVFLVASISIVKNMELAFNDIWGVESKRSLRDYLSILILFPAMAFTVLAVTASLRNYALVREVSDIPVIQMLETKAAPLILGWIVLLFLLIYIPNTKVRFLSALYGAIIAGTIWQLLNVYFTRFYVGYYEKGIMAALYASFVIFPLFLIWLYLSWLIVLLGTEIAYVHQNLNKITWDEQREDVSWRVKESVALKTILLISQKFFQNKKAPSQTDLAEYLDLPQYAVSRLLFVLSDLGLVNVIGGREARYAPAKPLETSSLREAIEKLRSYGALHKSKKQDDPISLLVEEMQGHHEKLLREAFPDTSIRELMNRLNEGQEKT